MTLPANNMAATYLYRAEVKRAFARYDANLRLAFLEDRCNIPPVLRWGYVYAWNQLRADIHRADYDLNARRNGWISE